LFWLCYTVCQKKTDVHIQGEKNMAEVELQQIGIYLISNLLSVSSTSAFYQGKQGKKALLIQRFTKPLTTTAEKEAFLIRAKQLKKLKHRGIINILDMGFDGDHAYLVMEYYAGKTLQEHITSGQTLAPDHVKRYLSPVASALHYAHMSNAIHGNLQPGNLIIGKQNDILLTKFSSTPPGVTYELDDFAFAIPYMSPEQLQGQITPGSDQYALAVMAYEWLCGRRPYDATERDLLQQQQQQAPLPAPRSLNAEISPAVERVIIQALSVDPAQRFPHIQAFADAYLSALMGFTVRTPAPTLTQRVIPITSSTPLPSAPSPLVPINQSEKPAQEPPSNDNRQSKLNQDSTLDPVINMQTPMSLPEEETSILPSRPKIIDITKRARLPKSEVGQAETSLEQTPQERDREEESDHAPAKPLKVANDGRLQTLVTADLCQGGVLSLSLPGYEERPAQIEMASLVSQAITQYVPAVVEAATGTGKSLAYLVPVVRSGQVAIVSTANKALQEQLFYKDIPFVQKYIKPFGAALVKGMGNYICIDRVESERVGLQYYAKNREFQRLVELINDPDAPFNGDIETLGFQLPPDIRGRVVTDGDQCAWSKCDYFGDCYVRQMREHAQKAQVIVVNHTLLLLDAAMDGFLLPERDVIILDEAHHLEEEATRCFTITIGPAQIQMLLAQRMLKDHSLMSLQDETRRNAEAAWMLLEQVADPGAKGRANLHAPFEEGLRLATSLSDLADSLHRQRPKDLPDKEGQLYDKLLKRTQNLAENIRTVFAVAQPDKFVYYVERMEGSVTRGFVLQASAAPLDVTSWLKERLFNQCNVICTSATLATVGPNPVKPEEKGPNFGYFRQRVGLDPQERSDVIERILPLTFDYESNALLYLPRDLPAPAFGAGSEDYMLAIAREMYKLVRVSRGRAFLLFSSKRMLDHAYELMSPHLPYPLLKQGDMPRVELTRRFREEDGAVLFGLKSFWEGVDIAGDALSLVVIDKLPFDPPDDPVHEARINQMKAKNENWFGIYVLPQAVLRLKQGLGRLLRTREDRGVMAILDTRLHTKGYGRLVLNALPPARRTSSLRDIDRFFAET
jgi:Rad3-related DNA helicase/serine/threonine protein kinase